MPSVSPALLDAILLGVVVEAVALALWLRRQGAARLVAPLTLHLASGAFLMLALRGSVSGRPSTIAPALLASLVAHVASLVRARNLR